MPKGPARAALGSGPGAFSSLLGAGGGAPAGFGAVIAAPGAIGNMIAGFGQPSLPPGSAGLVNLIALAAIAAMSILTAPLGAAAAHSLDPVKLKRVCGFYLAATAAFMLKDAVPMDAIGVWLGAAE